MLTVSVEVCAVVPLIVTEPGRILHVAGSLAAVGVMVQLRLTVPVKPFDGVTTIVEVFPLFAPGSMLIAAPVIANAAGGAAVTVRIAVADASL